MVNKIKFEYGKGEVSFPAPANYKVLQTDSVDSSRLDWNKKIEQSFSSPIGSPTLTEFVSRDRPEKIVIIINDITRPVPYEIVLQPMLDELLAAGIDADKITLLIATGMHRPMTLGEVRETLGSEIINNYHWENHLCDEEMSYIGELKEGIPLYVNPLVLEADFLCAVGVIAPHYMAGFSGGRKSLLPGVCGRKTIEVHHSLMRLPNSRTAVLSNNKFHETMDQAAGLCNLRFIANVIADSRNQVVDLVTGNYKAAWEKGVELCRESSIVRLEEAADAVIVSAGGFPKDINMYQAQKALENASYCVKDGAPIILIAECREGLGEEKFKEWLLEAEQPADLAKKIKTVFELGGHKAFAIARVAVNHPLYLYSSLDKNLSRECFMEPVGVGDVKEILTDDRLVYILPHGANTVPMVKYG